MVEHLIMDSATFPSLQQTIFNLRAGKLKHGRIGRLTASCNVTILREVAHHLVEDL